MSQTRRFKQGHRDAGYHLQEWGPIPTRESDLIGTYEGTDGERIDVRWKPSGALGVPELELQFGGPDGWKCTVIDEATAAVYLIQHGAAELVDD